MNVTEIMMQTSATAHGTWLAFASYSLLSTMSMLGYKKGVRSELFAAAGGEQPARLVHTRMYAMQRGTASHTPPRKKKKKKK